jgi:hypothetical protein
LLAEFIPGAVYAAGSWPILAEDRGVRLAMDIFSPFGIWSVLSHVPSCLHLDDPDLAKLNDVGFK